MSWVSWKSGTHSRLWVSLYELGSFLCVPTYLGFRLGVLEFWKLLHVSFGVARGLARMIIGSPTTPPLYYPLVFPLS